jgi:hypothetical protein
MITTIEIKAHRDDVFEIGSGPTKILILGSCRTVAYLNYLNRYNQGAGEPFTIYSIEPNNWSWDTRDNPVDLDKELEKLETNERFLSIIQETDIFIHEHYAHFQMFNTVKDSPKNIYQFGMSPTLDITIPNFHDHFILEKDYEACGISTPENYIERGEHEIEKFCGVCGMSSFPEFGDHFRENWRLQRYFWRPNHVSAVFSIELFALMNTKFLKLRLTTEFWNEASKEDLFKEPHTPVTQRDIDGYRLQWN